MARRKQPPLPEGDDGRTIVEMNVPGMPWYVPREEAGGPKAAAGEPEAPARPAREPMTREQIRLYRHAAVKAGLIIVLVFGAAFGLFIAFCDFVWFR